MSSRMTHLSGTEIGRAYTEGRGDLGARPAADGAVGVPVTFVQGRRCVGLAAEPRDRGRNHIQFGHSQLASTTLGRHDGKEWRLCADGANARYALPSVALRGCQRTLQAEMGRRVTSPLLLQVDEQPRSGQPSEPLKAPSSRRRFRS